MSPDRFVLHAIPSTSTRSFVSISENTKFEASSSLLNSDEVEMTDYTEAIENQKEEITQMGILTNILELL